MRVTQDYRLFVCPAGSEVPLKNVLDAGCGTGIWTVEFGTQTPLFFPEVE